MGACYRWFAQITGSQMEVSVQKADEAELWGPTPAGKGRQQDWAEGEAGLWCSHSVALAGPTASSELPKEWGPPKLSHIELRRLSQSYP